MDDWAGRVVRTALARRDTVDVESIKKYFVLSTPRTGSSMFCEALEANDLGWPVEWFNELYIKHVCNHLGTAVQALDMRDYVRTVILGSYNPASNVFGVNFHVGQYRWHRQNGYDLFDLGFRCGYYLERRDKAKQAYSLAKSQLTGFWSRDSELRAGFTKSPDVNISLKDFCQALLDVVTDAEEALELMPSVTRRFVLEDMLAAGLSEPLRLVRSDLGLEDVVIQADVPTEPQSTDSDAQRLRAIRCVLGLAGRRDCAT